MQQPEKLVSLFILMRRFTVTAIWLRW